MILLSGCATQPVATTVGAPKTGESVPSVALVADAQLHNIYGVGLRQMTGGADWISKVAIRNPELNLLAPLVLSDLVTAVTAEPSPNSPALLLALGDITNIACSGEFDLFVKMVAGAAPRATVLLLAHGNHDSYLMGTVNSYIPGNIAGWMKPAAMGDSPVPTDEHWWGELHAPIPNTDRNWRDGCFDCSGTNPSSPMNKARWMRRYLDLLATKGLVNIAPPPKEGGQDIFPLQYVSQPGSPLASLNFQAEGWWVRPRFGPTPGASSFMSSYKSFFVQQADIDARNRLIIIDTSVKESARGGPAFVSSNAGSWAEIGAAQFKIIERLIRGTPAGMQLTIAGHFPLKDLSGAERRRLLGLLAGRPGWNYLSAHTHYGEKNHRGFAWADGFEINIGSTTDWPMVAHRVYFDASGSIHPIKVAQLTGTYGIKYTKPPHENVAEPCRHLPAAKLLAGWNGSYTPERWDSPPPCADCELATPEQWAKIGRELAGYRSEIERRYFSDPAYRNFVRSIAAAASKSEFHSRDLSGLIP